ncbi:MAG: hypothetical protein ACREP6_05790 [Candidatus Binataceae bacterium]
MSARTRFATAFKKDHRAIRDSLLNLIQAFHNHDLTGVRFCLGKAALLAELEFRFADRAFYPALAAVLDKGQMGKLLSNHDRAIDLARKLGRLAARIELTEYNAQSGAKYAQSLMSYVSECEDLSIMAEVLPEPAIQRALETRGRSRAAGLNLLRWADKLRSVVGS